MLENYTLLASLDSNTRIRAAENLLKSLLELCVNSSKDTKTGIEECNYAVKRLLKGLASSRDAARQGFAVALSELLTLIQSLPPAQKSLLPHTPSQLLELLKSQTSITGMSASEKDQKDIKLAHIFAIQAFLSSNVFSTPETTLEDIKPTVDLLFAAAKFKSYLGESSASCVVSLVSQLRDTKFFNDTVDYIISIISAIESPFKSLDYVWIVVYIETCSKRDLSKLIEKCGWKGKKVFCKQNLKSLAGVLKDPTGGINPHKLWDVVFELLLSGDKKCDVEFEEFWKSAVDDSLLSAQSTHERKYLGLQIFRSTFTRFTTTNIKNQQKLLTCIISDPLLECILTNVKNQQAYLNRAVSHSIEAITTAVSSTTSRDLLLCLSSLLFALKSGQLIHFDRVTKTKLLSQIIEKMDHANAMKHLESVESVFISNEIEAQSPQYIEYFCSLCKSRPQDFELTTAILKLLNDIRLGTEIKPKLSITLTTKDYISTRILTLISELLPFPTGKSKSTDAAIKNPIKLVKEFLESVNVDVGFVNEVHGSLAEDQEDLNKLVAFESLVVFILLEEYLTGEQEWSENLMELKNCFGNMWKEKESDGENEEEEVNPVDVLIDLLVSFLAKPSAPLRNVATSVFKVFCNDIGRDGLNVLIEIIAARQNTSELFEEEEGEEDDEDEIDEEVDNTNKKSSNGVDEAENESDEESDVDDYISDISEDEEDGDPELRLKISQALGTLAMPIPTTKDGEYEDEDVDDLEDGSDSELSDVGDDEMADFDEKLAEIFRERKKIQESKKDMKTQTVNFKIRVLGLLEIYIVKGSQSPIFLSLLAPLLSIYFSTVKGDSMIQKIQSLVNKVVKPKETSKLESVEDIEVACEALKELHELLLSPAGKKMAGEELKLVASACAAVVKSLVGAEKKGIEEESKTVSRVTEIYISTLASSVQQKKPRLQALVFTDLTQRYPVFTQPLMNGFLDAIGDVKNGFVVVQMFQIVGKWFEKLATVEGEKEFVEKIEEKVLKVLDEVKSQSGGEVRDKKRKHEDDEDEEDGENDDNDDNDEETKEKGMTPSRVKDLIIAVHGIAKKSLSDDIEVWSGEELGVRSKEITQIPKYSTKPIRKAVNNLLSLFGFAMDENEKFENTESKPKGDNTNSTKKKRKIEKKPTPEMMVTEEKSGEKKDEAAKESKKLKKKVGK